MTAVTYADEGLERQFCGWLVGAPAAELARHLPRIREDLFTMGVGRMLVAAVRQRFAAGATIDAASLLTAIRAEGSDMSASLLAHWHVEWSEMVAPPTSMLDALEDLEMQRIARTIRQTPPAATGRDSVDNIRDALGLVPTTDGAKTVAAFDAALEVTREFAAPLQSRIRTGIGPLDRMVGGFRPGELVVVGARTSQGKSVFALRLARGIYQAEQRPVLYHSLEMSRQELVKRCIADLAGIENWRVQRAAWFDRTQEAAAVQSARAIAEWRGLHFLDASVPFSDTCALYEQWAAMHGNAAAILVDYIGLIRGVRGAERRYQELGIITHTLKAMARRLGIVIVAVSQLNRQAASSEGPPQLHELRESGDIEQDADTVMLLHAPHHESHDVVAQRHLDCIIAKQRSGGLGTIELGFVREFCRIEEPDLLERGAA